MCTATNAKIQQASIYSYGANTRKRKKSTEPGKDEGKAETPQPTAKRKKNKSKKSNLAPADAASDITSKQPKRAPPKPKKNKKKKKKKSKQKQKAGSAGGTKTGTGENATKTDKASTDEQRRLIAALSVGVDDVDEVLGASDNAPLCLTSRPHTCTLSAAADRPIRCAERHQARRRRAAHPVRKVFACGYA